MVEFCLEVNRVMVNKVDKILDLVMVIKRLLFNMLVLFKVLYKLKKEEFWMVLFLKMVIFMINRRVLMKKVRVN